VRLVQGGPGQERVVSGYPGGPEQPRQLVKIKRDLENQIRGLLKNYGLVIDKAGGTVFRRRVE